jgi:uncharacterized protein (TIGR03437 family)
MNRTPLLVIVFCAITFLVTSSQAQVSTKGPAINDAAAAFFDDSVVREIRLYPEDPNWYNTLLQAHQNEATSGDPYFPCRFKYNNVELPKIGFRMKGNSSFRRNGIKKPFKLDFNEYDDNLNFLGLKKLNLNNGDLQPDFIREKLLHDFASKYVAALRSVFVRLYINDAYYGLYLAVEQPDKTMMESRFGNDEDGNLYEGEERMGTPGTPVVRPDLSYLGPNQSAYQNVYLLKTNETQNDYSGLIQFLDVLNNTATADLPTKLEPLCDVENWLYGMAINNLFVNLDSYLGVAAEYYLYDRDRDGKFIHIQWDHNETFGITGDGTPRLTNPFITDPFYIPANSVRPLLQKLWAVNDYRRLYLRMLARYTREGFDPTTYAARVTQLADLIRPHLTEDPNRVFSMAQFETNLNNQVTSGNLAIPGVNQFVQSRYNYLRPFLNTQALASDVRLNEVITVNNGSFKDEVGDADAWLELYNPGPGPVTLTNFYLTDDTANPTKWQVPARTVADGAFLTLWLDAETNEGDTHASFKPSATGGKLYLYQSASGTTTQLDTTTYPAMPAGQSYIRLREFGTKWTVTAKTTPAAANIDVIPASNGTGILLINEIMADNDSAFQDPNEAGAYEDWFEVYNPGAAAVNMSGMYITDNLSNPTKWKVPDGVSIPAGGRLVFMADNEPAQGGQHATWQLSGDGEAIGIYDTDGKTLIDSYTFGTQQTDISIGRVTDGAATWSYFKPATPGAANGAALAHWITNGASFHVTSLAPLSLASAFGENLTATGVAAQLPLPTTLGGVTITITDSANQMRSAPLLYAGPTQVNFQIPADTAAGRARVTLHSQGGVTTTGELLIEAIAPGLFAANTNGQGIGAMDAVRVDANGAQTPVQTYRYDSAQQRQVGVPISLGAETDKIFLSLYGTGLRGVQNLSDVTVEVGGVAVPVTYAGRQPQYEGLDQMNIGPLPRSLAGRGEVTIVTTIKGKRVNRLTVVIQ